MIMTAHGIVPMVIGIEAPSILLLGLVALISAVGASTVGIVLMRSYVLNGKVCVLTGVTANRLIPMRTFALLKSITVRGV